MPSTGCTLPEDLRRYYLDAMGIQLWQPRNSLAVRPVEESPVDDEMIKSTGLDDTPLTTDRADPADIRS
jgi:hypothetical protein